MENTQELWRGGPKLTQRPEVFPLCMDAVLLAWFAKCCGGKHKRICELGSGCGVISLLLAESFQTAVIDALDISAAAAELTAHNAEQNGLGGRITAYCADMRDENSPLKSGGYDMLVCNPPYFQQNGGGISEKLAAARSETECTLQDVCAAARRLAGNGAELLLVYRPERLTALLEAMRKFGFEPKKLRFVQHSASHAPSAVLVSGKLSAKPGGLSVLPPLLVCKENGENTEEFKRIYTLEEK